MSQNTAVVADNKAPSPDRPTPPEEQFWKRYSPHHEFPLSGVTSAAVHVLFGILLVLGIIFGIDWLGSKEKPVPVDAITVVAGGGGSKTGVGDGSGEGDRKPPEEAVDQQPRDTTNPAAVARPELPKGDLPPVPVKLPEFKDDAFVKRLVEQGNAAAVAVNKLDQETRDKLRQGLQAGKGEGGPGSGGGRGTGTGPGQGEGAGDGKDGRLSVREKRVLRWKMIFNTQDGEDYVRQLHGLGAILAIPDPQDPRQYLVIRDLTKRPAKGEAEDLSQIKRIFWVDETPQSVRSLSQALRIPVPPRVVAFFPDRLEQDLLRLEKAYRKREEKDIQETEFRVVRGGNSYVPQVVGQR